jgi:phosphatidyl-myo-inositol dimannoside synthase
LKAGLSVLALMPDAYGGRGGIAQYNRDLLDAWAAAPGVARIDVLTRAAPDALGALPSKVAQHPSRSNRLHYALAAGLRLLRDPPDILFCGHLNLAPLVLMALRPPRPRLVVQLHGIEAWPRPRELWRRAVEAADMVFCVSRHTRRQALSWSSSAPERVMVLPNTVSDAYSPGDIGAARRRFGLKGEKALLSVGRLDARERYKGQDRMIRLLPALRERLGDVIYLVAGDGDDRPRLEALSREWGVAEHVRFLGQVADADLPELYRAADLFVLPSTGEGFGIVFLEAMASGTPALGLAVMGAVDALADGELGDAVDEAGAEAVVRRLQLPRRDPAALAAAVRARFGRPTFGERATQMFGLLAAPIAGGL